MELRPRQAAIVSPLSEEPSRPWWNVSTCALPIARASAATVAVPSKIVEIGQMERPPGRLKDIFVLSKTRCNRTEARTVLLREGIDGKIQYGAKRDQRGIGTLCHPGQRRPSEDVPGSDLNAHVCCDNTAPRMTPIIIRRAWSAMDFVVDNGEYPIVPGGDRSIVWTVPFGPSRRYSSVASNACFRESTNCDASMQARSPNLNCIIVPPAQAGRG